MKKILIGIIILLLGVIAYFFIFQDRIFFRKIVKENEQIKDNYKEYENKITGDKKTTEKSWFENDYVKIYYSNDWTLDTSETNQVRFNTVLTLKSPFDQKTSANPYIISVKVYTPEQYPSSTAQDKDSIKTAVENNDLNLFVKTAYPGNSLGLTKDEFVTLNGTGGYMQLNGNQNVFYGGNINFIKNGKIIKVEIKDMSQLPIASLSNTSVGLLNLLDAKPYGGTVKSIIIK